MKRLHSLWALFAIVIKRLTHHPGLSISSLLGILSILGLVVCVPVFTNGVLSQVLGEQLAEKATRNHRSLFSIHAYYSDNASYSPLTLDTARLISTHFSNRLEKGLGLKVDQIVLQVVTPPLVWVPEKIQSTQPAFPQAYMSFTSSETLAGKIRLVEGAWPQESGDPDSPIPVAVLEAFADDNYLNVGDIYRSGNLRAEVVGIFRPIDPGDPAWFYDPEITFRNELWVPMSFFEGRLPAAFDRLLNYTSWYVIVDDASLRFARSVGYARGMLRLENELRTLLPKSSMDYSPLDMLSAYEARLKILTALFYAAGAPVLALALLFTWLISSIAVGEREAEMAVMAARGTSGWQALALNLAESCFLLALALPLSLGVGWLAAILMGQTELFLRFTLRPAYTFSLTDANPAWLGFASLAVILARLAPLLGGLKPSIVALKSERGRSTKRPIWERYYLDLGLLLPGIYAYLAMRQRAEVGLAAAAAGAEGSGYDPLMFLASSIFALALSMLALRLFPLLLRLLAVITERRPTAWTYLAVQEVARRPRDYASAMLLILISLCFAVFSASMAKTLERWLLDSQYYQAGTDLAIKEYEMPSPGPPGAGGPPADASPANSTRAVQSMVSLERHLDLPEIASATYVGNWTGAFSYGTEKSSCKVIGIDRLTFPNVAFYRRDFASEPLGALMNGLASRPPGVLIPERLAEETGLRPGDRIKLEAAVGLGGEWIFKEMAVAGVYRYFPTVYPTNEPTLIADLNALFGRPDAVMGVDVWLRLSEGSRSNEVIEDLRAMAARDMMLVEVRGDALGEVTKGMARPEWVGLFGVLNVGFLLTGLLPGIGFVLYSFASLRRRLIGFGILQALGLSTRQAAASLVLEQVLLMGIALAGGAAVGLVTSALFLPFLQVGAAGAAPVPPFEVQISWREAAWLCLAFGVIFLATLGGAVLSLRRLKIFQAVKMGEAV